MVCLCGIHLLLFLLLSDWEKLWLHQEYLESYTDPGWVRLLGEEFAETVVRTTPLWAILSALCVCRLIGTRNTFLKIIASAMSIIYFLLLLSLHSRAAVFVPALLAINYIVLGLKRRRFMAAIMLFIATLALMGALEGRTTDQHGLSTIPETILNPFVSLDPVGAISQTLMDFCQGVVVTAESLQLPDDFDLKYKILVFSPFPSVIDGYSSIREQSEHRLHGFVPMSGVGELLHFGWVYTCVLLIGLTALIRAHTKIVQKRPAVFLICNFLIMLSIYLLFSYPVRNALRYYWIAVALFVAVDFARRWFPAVDSARRNGEEFDRAQSKPVQPKFLFHPRK
jgi:hypothetical protein